MVQNIDTIFEGNLTRAFKHDMKNFANFHQSTFESLKIGTFIGSFNKKWKMYEIMKLKLKQMNLKLARELCAITIKKNAKFEKELTSQFKIDMRILGNFDTSTRKSQNICTLMSCF